MLRSFATCIGLWWVAAAAGHALADRLDNELLERMPQLIQRCQSHGASKVAVIGPAELRVGKTARTLEPAICEGLPGRVESALALKLSSRQPELLILRGARRKPSAVAAGHVADDPADRNVLLAAELTPAWGDPRPARPDLLILPEVSASADRRTVAVKLIGLDAQQRIPLLEFDLAVDRNLLAELGQGYSLASAPVRGVTDETIFSRVATNVAQTRQLTAGAIGAPPTRNISRVRIEPQTSAEFPVDFALYYDNRPQPLTLDSADLGSHNYLGPEPAAGQSLTFGLKNRTQQPLGVVLLVNGVSTLYEQEGAPAGMNKWVLEPGVEYRVKGYHQRGNEKYRAISALTEEESLRRYHELGGEPAAGLIHLYVFRTVEPEGKQADLFVYNLGRLPHITASAPPLESLGELQQAIARRSDLFPPGTRPLAGWGKEHQETLAEKRLGAVTLSDAMIVRYSNTRPTAGVAGE